MKLSAKIYKPTKSVTQSGTRKSQLWVLEYDDVGCKYYYPLTGLIGTEGTLEQVHLKFTSKENAIRFARSNGINFSIVEPHGTLRHLRSYADNFILPLRDCKSTS